MLIHPQGLAGMYADVLKFSPQHCSLLLGGAMTWQEHGAPPTSGGFDFIVNAVWPEVVAQIDEKASVIFAPGNPDTFHTVHQFYYFVVISPYARIYHVEQLMRSREIAAEC